MTSAVSLWRKNKIMARVFPVLRTTDFLLRELTDNDIAPISSIWGGRKLAERTCSCSFTCEQSICRLKLLRALWHEGTGIRWGIESEGRLIGTCGFHNIRKEEQRGELGFDLSGEFQGRGYMRKALEVALDYSFNIMRFKRVEAFIDVDNERTAELLWRLSFKLDGVMRDYAMTSDGLINQSCFSLLKREWQAR